MNLSVVIPAYNEAESLPELFRQIRAAVPADVEYEVIVIDDGSKDETLEVLRREKENFPQLRAYSFRRNYGKSAALAKGFAAAKGDFVVTMDADLQDDPEEIVRLLREIREKELDLVSGWKKHRKDPISKRWPSKIYNLITSIFSGIRLHDFNCGLKIYRKDVVKSLDIYGEMHRFIPVLAHKTGFRVGEMVVNHRKREHGKSKYGARRFLSGFFDLITVLFLTGYSTKPLHIFGLMGMLSFLSGFFIEAYLTWQWLHNQGIGKRPLFFLGILLIIVGIQFIGVGLLAEMISARQAKEVVYHVKEEL